MTEVDKINEMVDEENLIKMRERIEKLDKFKEDVLERGWCLATLPVIKDRLEKLEKDLQELTYQSIQAGIRQAERIEALEEKLKTPGFTEHKASGWEGVKREPAATTGKRSYTGWE